MIKAGTATQYKNKFKILAWLKSKILNLPNKKPSKVMNIKGVNPKKTEGDKSTPKGKFSLGKIYYRADRVLKPDTKIPIKIITKIYKSNNSLSLINK